jgi:hypothetical protein
MAIHVGAKTTKSAANPMPSAQRVVAQAEVV